MADMENQSRLSTDQDMTRLVDDLVAIAKRRGILLGAATAFLTYFAAPLARDVAVKVFSDFSVVAIKEFFNRAMADEEPAKDSETVKADNDGQNAVRNDSTAVSQQPAKVVPTFAEPAKELGWVAVVTSARTFDGLADMQATVESVARACSVSLGRGVKIRVAPAPNGWWGALAVDPNGATHDFAKEIAHCFEGYADIQGPCLVKSANVYGLR